MSATIQQLQSLLSIVYKKDEAWSAELAKAFGNDAGDRRYDMNKAYHPDAANAAHAELYQARDAFNKAGGYHALFSIKAAERVSI